MARLFAPGPAMVTFWLMVMGPLPQVSEIMLPFSAGAKWMVAPGAAEASTERKVPDEPSSPGLVTVCADAGKASVPSSNAMTGNKTERISLDWKLAVFMYRSPGRSNFART
jgi:hypothetical protein